jgi:hypothetical protein
MEASMCSAITLSPVHEVKEPSACSPFSSVAQKRVRKKKKLFGEDDDERIEVEVGNRL